MKKQILELDEFIRQNEKMNSSLITDWSKEMLLEAMKIYANKKAADEIKDFCEYVMHPQSDLHKDAKDWINSRLK